MGGSRAGIYRKYGFYRLGRAVKLTTIGFVRAFVDEKALARHLLYPKKQPATFEIKFAEKINVFDLFL